jgi:hypothetical protein
MPDAVAFQSRWWIVFGATLSMLVAQGPVILYTLGLFIKPLNQESGHGRICWQPDLLQRFGEAEARLEAIVAGQPGDVGNLESGKEDLCAPRRTSYYAIPTFVFYPVFIVMFGLNRWPLIAIGFIFSIVAVEGIKSLKTNWLDLWRCPERRCGRPCFAWRRKD